MICHEFSYPKGLCVYAERNPSFVSELLTYEVVKEDAPDIGMLAQYKPVIFVHEISKEKYNYHEPPNDFCEKIKTKSEPINCSD